MRVTMAGRIVAWGLAVASLAANVAGYRFDLYQWAWWFDRVLHGSTLFAMSFWLCIVVFARGINEDHRLLGFLMIAAVGIASGALWEVTEWTFNLLVLADAIKGKYDSILDIVMDSGGALLAAGLVQLYLVDSYKPSPPSRMPPFYYRVR